MDIREDQSAYQPQGRHRTVLFLQGPITPFTRRLAARLEAMGVRTLAVHFNFGDQLFWRRAGGIAYRGRAADWPGYIAELLDRERVTDLFLTGEQRAYHRAAIQAARARNISVVTTDFGYLRPDWLTLELDGMTGCSRFPRRPAAIHDLARRVPQPEASRLYEDSFFHLALWDVAYHAAACGLWFLYPHHRWEHRHHPLAVYAGMVPRLLDGRRRHRRAEALIAKVRRQRRPYFLFPLQMENDAQIRVYSPFADMVEPLRTVIRSFAANAAAEALLMVKLHPLDPGLRPFAKIARETATAAGVADRVHFFDGGRLDPLLDRAQGVITVNSTVGLWAIRRGRPVVTLGDAIFNVPGLVQVGELDRFWQAPTAPDPKLCQAFLRALAGTIQIRGVYHAEPGLTMAVEAAAERIAAGLVNAPVTRAAAAAAAPVIR